MKKETGIYEGDQLTIIEYDDNERQNELMCKLSGCLLVLVFVAVIAVMIILSAS